MVPLESIMIHDTDTLAKKRVTSLKYYQQLCRLPMTYSRWNGHELKHENIVYMSPSHFCLCVAFFNSRIFVYKCRFQELSSTYSLTLTLNSVHHDCHKNACGT